jgi:hypothetical protein
MFGRVLNMLQAMKMEIVHLWMEDSKIYLVE